jgi:hypothetical protein
VLLLLLQPAAATAKHAETVPPSIKRGPLHRKTLHLTPTWASSLMVRPLMVSTRPSATYTASTVALLLPVPPYSDESVASVSVPACNRNQQSNSKWAHAMNISEHA